MRFSRRIVKGVALLSLLLAVEYSGGSGQPSAKPILLPGGVADSEGKHGYVRNSAAGIDALDLQTGRLLWRSREPVLPLLVFGERLIAREDSAAKANQLRLAVLDLTERGQRLRSTDAIAFPDWVSVTPARGKTFAFELQVQGGRVRLYWSASARYAGGAPPPAQVAAAAAKQAAGAVEIDIETGRVETLGLDQLPPRPAAKLPEDVTNALEVEYADSSVWEARPVRVGDKLVLPSIEASERGQRLVLATWDLASGKLKSRKELLEGGALVRHVTPDGRALFVHDESSTLEVRLWFAFSLETGERLGELRYEPGTQAVSLLGSRVYYAVQSAGRAPAQKAPAALLKAADLKSGKRLWEHPIQGVQFSTPWPLRR